MSNNLFVLLLAGLFLFFVYSTNNKNKEGFKGSSKKKSKKSKKSTKSKSKKSKKCDCDCDCKKNCICKDSKNVMNEKTTGINRKKMEEKVKSKGRKVHRSEPKFNEKKSGLVEQSSSYKKFEPIVDNYDNRFLRNSYETNLDILSPKAYNYSRNCKDDNLCTKCLIQYAKDKLQSED